MKNNLFKSRVNRISVICLVQEEQQKRNSVWAIE